MKFDVGIIGAGISGFSTALRLQNQGLSTLVLEAHGIPGGCAGYFRRKGFSFDVGATTLVDFVEGGVGGNLFEEIGLSLPKGEYLDYLAWLPDRQVTLYRNHKKWATERLSKIGSTQAHKKFWNFLDKVTRVFWDASRKGIKLPIQHPGDILNAARHIGLRNLPLARFINHSMGEVLKKFQLGKDKALTALLSMLIEDTVHSTLNKAPFINAALGISIRGAGLMRPEGGMRGFWQYLTRFYKEQGGTLKCGHKVEVFEKKQEGWNLNTRKGDFQVGKLISTLPIDLTYDIAPIFIQKKLQSFIQKNENARGGAIVVFLGVPELEVSGQSLTHHQLFHNYEQDLGNGNNMFISASASEDTLCAPPGHRAVMVSTHCNLEDWQNLSPEEYIEQKNYIGQKLLDYARKVYPNLGNEPIVYEIATPLTYQKFTSRKEGAVGGYKQMRSNSNFHAIPQNIGVKDFWIGGDSTWPGLGTVAGVMGSKIIAQQVLKSY